MFCLPQTLRASTMPGSSRSDQTKIASSPGVQSPGESCHAVTSVAGPAAGHGARCRAGGHRGARAGVRATGHGDISALPAGAGEAGGGQRRWPWWRGLGPCHPGLGPGSPGGCPVGRRLRAKPAMTRTPNDKGGTLWLGPPQAESSDDADARLGRPERVRRPYFSRQALAQGQAQTRVVIPA
jgi:hypothetical protein